MNLDASGRTRSPRIARRLRHLTVAALAVAAAVLAGTGIVLAQTDESSKVMTGGSIAIPAEQVIPHDLYVFAGTAVVDGRVEGDLVVAGGRLEVNGEVEGDLVAAGGTVTVRGSVSGDLRAAGGTVVLAGSVAEDAVLTGGSMTVERTSEIGEDLIVSGGPLDLAGTVAGDLVGRSAGRAGDGTVEGNDGLIVDAPEPVSPADVALDAVRHLLAVVLIAGLALWFAPRALATAASITRHRPLLSIAWGVVSVVGVVLAVVLLALLGVLLALGLGVVGFGALVALELVVSAVTIAAIVIGMIVGALFLADAVVGLALAGLVSRTEPASRLRSLLLIALGAAVVVAVTAIPVVGTWIKLLIVIVGIGAMVAAVRATRRVGDAAPTPAA